MIVADPSTELLAKELAAAEKSLQETEKRLTKQEDPTVSFDVPGSLLEQLTRLTHQADSLALVQEVTECLVNCPIPTEGETIFAEAKLCEGLALIVLEKSNGLLVVPEIYEEYYLTLYDYLFDRLLDRLREGLETARYPKQCAKLFRHVQGEASACAGAASTSRIILPQVCRWLTRLEQLHRNVVEEVEGRHIASPNSVPAVVVEFLRPLLGKIRFHFVDPSDDRTTTTRIDRLPEWLLTYTREHVLSPQGPFALLESMLHGTREGPVVAATFLVQVVRLVQWVLNERGFFQSQKVSGPDSNPFLLYNAMEHFLQFDRLLQELWPIDTVNESPQRLGLMDLLVASDNELFDWWIQREREFVFSTLFEDQTGANVPKPLANHVSPRAEVFGSLIRSVQCKASTLSVPGPFLHNVAVPLCSQFVDALHETSNDLRNLLCQRFVNGGPPPEHLLCDNLNGWMEIINGTNLAAKILLRDRSLQQSAGSTDTGSSQSDHDLARFGRSLERLLHVMIEELARTFVDTILIERCQLASYLMMASHVLSSEQWDGENEMHEISPELKETKAALSQLQHVCHSILSVNGDNTAVPASCDQQIAEFAPRAVRSEVFSRLADKFMEVALDVQGVAPDVWQSGAKVFARDVDTLFGLSDLQLVRRLLDVTRLMSMETNGMLALFSALGGLVGTDTFLDMQDFTADATLFETAQSMIRAKGFAWIELEDAISVLNRRRN